MNNMKVSIVTPVYNGEDEIERLFLELDDLLKTYNIEWILVNDKSTDSTKQKIQGISKRNNLVRCVDLNENSGPGIARHMGVQTAENDYVFLLDVDDSVYIERFIEFMNFSLKMNPGKDFYYAPLDIIYDRREISDYDRRDFKKHNIIEVNGPMGFIFNTFPQPSSLLLKRDFFVQYNSVNKLRWGEDFLMYLCLAKYGRGVRWNKAVSCYFVDGEGRGSKLSFKYRYELSIKMYVISFKEGKVMSSLSYSTFLTIRHLLSYIYKRMKLIIRS